VTFSVPANWRPIDASDAVLLPEPCDSQLAEGRYVFGMAAGLAALTCPAEGPSFGPLVAGVRVGPTVELRDTRAAWDELVDVGGRWESVRVRFGVDQQVSLAILGSIRSTKPVFEPTPLRCRAYGGVIDAAGAPRCSSSASSTPCPRRSEVEFDSPASAGLTSTVSGPEMVSRGPRNRSR